MSGLTRGSFAVDHVAVGAEVLVVADRNGIAESAHLGHVVVVDGDGKVVAAAGNPQAQVFPRSSFKPVQAAAMRALGVELEPPQLALAAASHSGQDAHLAGVRSMLKSAGLTEADLRNTPGLPLFPAAARAWESTGPMSITQNCSGKHAAMLATCVHRGWTRDDYRDQAHPLQQELLRALRVMSGEESRCGVDGCGAPAPCLPLVGMARAMTWFTVGHPRGGNNVGNGQQPSPNKDVTVGQEQLAAQQAVAEGSSLTRGQLAKAAGEVAQVMNEFPFLVGGTKRESTLLMEQLEGLLVKDGAEGFMVAATPTGHGIAIKILDGSRRAPATVLLAVLQWLGCGEGIHLQEEEMLGAGKRVGSLQPVFSFPEMTL